MQNFTAQHDAWQPGGSFDLLQSSLCHSGHCHRPCLEACRQAAAATTPGPEHQAPVLLSQSWCCHPIDLLAGAGKLLQAPAAGDLYLPLARAPDGSPKEDQLLLQLCYLKKEPQPHHLQVAALGDSAGGIPAASRALNHSHLAAASTSCCRPAQRPRTKPRDQYLQYLCQGKLALCCSDMQLKPLNRTQQGLAVAPVPVVRD